MKLLILYNLSGNLLYAVYNSLKRLNFLKVNLFMKFEHELKKQVILC